MFSICDMREIEVHVKAVVQQFPSLLAVYLFGSVNTGKCGPLSDIDIALLVAPSDNADDVCGEVQDELCRRLKTDKIDLVSLIKSPPPLAYRVIRDGRCICCRDKKTVENFESLTVMKYLDFKPVRDRAFKISRTRTLEVA